MNFNFSFWEILMCKFCRIIVEIVECIDNLIIYGCDANYVSIWTKIVCLCAWRCNFTRGILLNFSELVST